MGLGPFQARAGGERDHFLLWLLVLPMLLPRLLRSPSTCSGCVFLRPTPSVSLSAGGTVLYHIIRD